MEWLQMKYENSTTLITLKKLILKLIFPENKITYGQLQS
jgi:hypothetical protein